MKELLQKAPPTSVTNDIKGDGLCFFRCVSRIISVMQTCAEDMKNQCNLYIKNNYKSIPFMPTNAANKCLTGEASPRIPGSKGPRQEITFFDVLATIVP